MCPGASPSDHSQSFATPKGHLQRTLGWAMRTQDSSQHKPICHGCSMICTINIICTESTQRKLMTSGWENTTRFFFHYVCVCDITNASILGGRCVLVPLSATSLAPCCLSPGTLCSSLCLPSFSSCCLVGL